ncbi:hypothetical protein Tco_0846905, partial [Tanacetum coccineum]
CYINFTKSAHFQNSTIKVDCKSQIELFFVYKDPIFESQDISTSNTHQQSLADASSETRPPMLERGSYIPWVSRFRRFLNRKRENRKWLNKEIDEGPYEFKKFTPSETEEPRMKTKEDLRGDYLKHYEAEIEAMKLILISIPNDIYNSVRLAKRLTEDTYDDLFDYLQQIEKLVNASRAKKLEKSHDHLALVAYTGSSSRNTSPYYVTHPALVVDFDDDYQGDAVQNTYDDPLTFAMILLAQYRFKAGTLVMMAEIQDVHMFKRKSLRVIMLVIVQSQEFEIQRPSYDSAFLSEVQTPSTSYVNPLFAKDKQEQKYLKQPKIINNTIGDDQINSNIIFDEPNEDVNRGIIEYDNNIQESYELDQLARNAYKEAEKQQIIAKKVQQQNTVLTNQLESYKEKV